MSSYKLPEGGQLARDIYGGFEGIDCRGFLEHARAAISEGPRSNGSSPGDNCHKHSCSVHCGGPINLDVHSLSYGATMSYDCSLCLDNGEDR